MARDGGKTQVESIPSIINDILLARSLSRKSDSYGHICDNIIQGFSRQKCGDMPPLLLTDEDRMVLQRDREKAIKFEEQLARKKEEKYCDLVDKVQNVLRRIEEKNSQKLNHFQSSEIYDSTKSPSDFNNNPSRIQPEAKNVEFMSPKHVQRNLAQANFERSLSSEKPARRPHKRTNNSGRYSLPADFDAMYCNGKPSTEYGHYAYSNVQRPLSAYSDNHVVYGNHDDMYANHRDRSQSYGDKIGEHGDQFGNHGNSYSSSHGNAKNCSSPVDKSPSIGNHSSISEQKEFLAFEQKRLEEHYAVLQEQLMADFQRHQLELLQVYNNSMESQQYYNNSMGTQEVLTNRLDSKKAYGKSMDAKQIYINSLSSQDAFTHNIESLQSYNKSFKGQEEYSNGLDAQSENNQTLQSNLEKSFESDSERTFVQSTSGQESLSLLHTDELPQSPFGLNVTRDRNSLQSSSKLFQNSSSSQNLACSNTRRSARSVQRYSLPVAFLQDSNSSGARVTKGSSVCKGQRFNNISMHSIQNSNSFDMRNSFNSEASAQEFYDMPQFDERLREGNVINRKKTANKLDGGDAMTAQGDKKLGNSKGSAATIFGVVTSPKRTALSSFESRALKEFKNVQSHEHEFALISAHAKGFLTRLLFQTSKIHGLVTTVKDAKIVLSDMNSESSQSVTDRSFKERVQAQLYSAQSELRRIFIESAPNVRMQILQQNRRLIQEKEARNADKIYSGHSGSAHNRPKLSNVTMKKRLSRHESEKTPKAEKTGTPSAVKTRNSIKERNTPKSSTKSTTPKSKKKLSPVSNAATSGTEKTKTPSMTPELTGNTLFSETVITSTKTLVTCSAPVVTSSEAPVTLSGTLVRSSETVMTTPSVAIPPRGKTVTATTKTERSVVAAKTSTVVTTLATAKIDKKQDTVKLLKTKASGTPVKVNAKVTQPSRNRRRTWDTGVMKPIQGRISPTLPSQKTKTCNEKNRSTLSTARKVGLKLVREYNESSAQTSTCVVSGIDMGKTYKVNNKTEQPVKKTGATRSLAANLTQK